MSELQTNAFKLFLNVFTLLHFNYLNDAEKELKSVLDNDLSFMPDQQRMYCKTLAQTLFDWVQELKKEKEHV